MAATTTRIVPKGPTAPPREASEDDGFDREALLAKLFALPVPPSPHGGKPYPIHTPLGRILRLRGMRAMDLYGAPGAPHYYTISKYLAGKKEMLPHHRVAIARVLKVDPRIF